MHYQNGLVHMVSRDRRRKTIRKIYQYWRDSLERRLAGVDAALNKLEEQIARDSENETNTETI